jgi:hypothetical protein
MKETIENIIERLNSSCYSKVREILTEELSKLNPNRIDEERMREIWNNHPFSYNYLVSGMSEMIKKYNSTLPEPLVRLPEEMPDEFSKKINELAHGFPVLISEIWAWVVNTYGTPQKELPSVGELLAEIYDLKWNRLTPDECKELASHLVNKYSLNAKQELPSVEELSRELSKVHQNRPSDIGFLVHIAQHLIAKYKLDSKKEEWWETCDRFKCGATIFISDGYRVDRFGKAFLICDENIYSVDMCHPYTEPSIRERLIAKGVTNEEIEELMKEVKNENI